MGDTREHNIRRIKSVERIFLQWRRDVERIQVWARYVKSAIEFVSALASAERNISLSEVLVRPWENARLARARQKASELIDIKIRKTSVASSQSVNQSSVTQSNVSQSISQVSVNQSSFRQSIRCQSVSQSGVSQSLSQVSISQVSFNRSVKC